MLSCAIDLCSMRGFPYFARHSYTGYVRDKSDSANVMANMGLWLGVLDVDAISWLGRPPLTRSS